MLTLPFVCMRQCCFCPNHSRGKSPHCWIIEPESLLVCHCSSDRGKHLHCSNMYLLGNTKANWALPQPHANTARGGENRRAEKQKWLFLKISQSQTLRFRDPGGWRHVCTTFSLMPSAYPYLGAERNAWRGEAVAIIEDAADRHLSMDVLRYAAFCPYFPNQMASFSQRRFAHPYTNRPVRPSEPKAYHTDYLLLFPPIKPQMAAAIQRKK